MRKRFWVGILGFVLSLAAYAALNDTLLQNRNPLLSTAQPTVLPVEKAFPLRIDLNKEHTVLQLNWRIAEGYYLYRDKIVITSPVGLHYTLPPGTEIVDEFFGKQQVYFQDVFLDVSWPKTAPAQFSLTLSYQGCASAGFCYPPITETWAIDTHKGTITAHTETTENASLSAPTFIELENTPSAVTTLLANTQFGWVLLIFYGLGLLLTFTPCVLPMIPILSSIIVGQHTAPRSWHGFSLAVSYVAGMTITYTLAGIFAGVAGQTLQSYLQAPLFVSASAVILVLLALNLFDCYRLALPQRVEAFLHHSSAHLKGGRFLTALALGILSALIVSPCITAPLVGALTYISTTGDALLGGSALFSLSLGMGTPLLLLGSFGPGLLPQAGDWILVVQRIFGVLLLSVAIWLIGRLLPDAITLTLWGILAIITACYLGAGQFATPLGWPRFWQGCAWILLLYGILMIIRASPPLLDKWLPHTAVATPALLSSAPATPYAFIAVKSLADVQHYVAQSDKPVLLDFYAKWCATCKIIEHSIFPDPQIAPLLQQFTLLRADVTAQDKTDLALQQAFSVYAPPTLLFFAPHGSELKNERLVGNITVEALTQKLQSLLEI